MQNNKVSCYQTTNQFADVIHRVELNIVDRFAKRNEIREQERQQQVANDARQKEIQKTMSCFA